MEIGSNGTVLQMTVRVFGYLRMNGCLKVWGSGALDYMRCMGVIEMDGYQRFKVMPSMDAIFCKFL